jgi:methionine sulfoxide reductase heme-binding subunit
VNKLLLRYILIFGYLYLLFIPGYIFFVSRPGLPLNNATLYPLLGLYAFTLVALQVIIGANMRRLRPIFGPKLLQFHRYQGIFALLFALIHPFMVMSAFGAHKVIVSRDFLPEASRPHVVLGMLAGDLMIITVLTAVAAWKLQKFSSSWRIIHFANYGVFILAWIHSWFIGSDISTTPLKYVWLFYLAAWAVSLALRIGNPWETKPTKVVDPAAQAKTGDQTI